MDQHASNQREARGQERVENALSVETLRRSSSLHSPTRTLRLMEAEHSSRDNTPARIAVETLTNSRPRSNQRSRTPMRYESPLNPDEFRRETVLAAEAEAEAAQAGESAVHEARRVTIRPLAGRAIGTVVAARVGVDVPCMKTFFLVRCLNQVFRLLLPFPRLMKSVQLPPVLASRDPHTEKFVDGTMATLLI